MKFLGEEETVRKGRRGGFWILELVRLRTSTLQLKLMPMHGIQDCHRDQECFNVDFPLLCTRGMFYAHFLYACFRKTTLSYQDLHHTWPCGVAELVTVMPVEGFQRFVGFQREGTPKNYLFGCYNVLCSKVSSLVWKLGMLLSDSTFEYLSPITRPYL